jgi:hypothetical protein
MAVGLRTICMDVKVALDVERHVDLIRGDCLADRMVAQGLRGAPTLVPLVLRDGCRFRR